MVRLFLVRRPSVGDSPHEPGLVRNDALSPALTPEVALALQRGAGNQSFAAMLSRMPGRSAATAGAVGAATLGRQPSHAKTKPGADNRVEANPDVAMYTAQAVADVLQNQRGGLVSSASPKYRDALLSLWKSVSGQEGTADIPASRRLELLATASAGLEPVFGALRADPDQRAWLDLEVTPHLTRLRDSLRYAQARDRVEQAALGPRGELIEVPQDMAPRQQAQILHSKIPGLVKSAALYNEQAVRLGHDAIHHHAKEMLEHAKLPKELEGKRFDPGILVEVQNLLLFVDGFLTLTDEELAEHLNHPHGVFAGIASYTELVKAAVEIAWGCVGVTASFASAVARLSGQTEYAVQAAGLARASGLWLANVVAGIEILYGIAVILDPHATAAQKTDAGAHVAMGTAWFVGSRLGGAAVGAAASVAIMITYYELQWLAHSYRDVRLGLAVGWMSKAFETMGDAARRISDDAIMLSKAGLLAHAEGDPAQKKVLERVEADCVKGLTGTIDYFLEQCEPTGYAPGGAYKPGAFTQLRPVFKPLLRLQGATTPSEAAEAAKSVLHAIRWCFDHAQELIADAAGLAPPQKEGSESGHH
jgi:hypothetical protein